MTALLLVACVGMITGAFFIFRISPMDFTLGVFRRLTTGPKSIRDDINETTQRKKPGFFRREIMETQTILQATGKEQKFPALCAASLLLFAIGAGIAIVMNNFLLVPVLAAGMMFLPFWYIKLTAGHYKKDIAAEPETNCQGLFNQIHKNLQKRCQKHRMAPDTSFDRLHFSVQQVFAEIRIVWQLVDIWLPAPLDFGQFQRIGCFQCMIVACHI